MENNIFLKMNKNKFNPDVEQKLKIKENERDSSKFELQTTIYNPITGIIPNRINSVKDLVLEKDTTLDKINIQKKISEKNNERELQNNSFKPTKTKVINNEVREIVKAQPVNNTNYIETFEDMKRGSVNTNKPPNKKNYNNIMDGLKELGIIN
jgi:hypothetical protein